MRTSKHPSSTLCLSVALVAGVATLAACGGSSGSGGAGGSSGSSGSSGSGSGATGGSSGSSSGTGGSSGTGSSGGSGGSSGTGGSSGSSGSSGAGSSSGSSGSGGSGSGGAPDGGSSGGSGSSGSGRGGSSSGGGSASPTIPAPTGTCPTFANGMVTFSPAGIPARAAQVYMSSAAATMHGPLILYWYATGSSTAEVQYSLNTTLTAVEAAGGIVVAPQADPSAGQFEWFLVNGSTKQDDFLVADEIVACAAKSTGIDTKHIHTMGMSAGGLQTTAMSFLRSSYLASVVTYSGGTPPGFALTMQDPANKFSALIFEGGTADNVFNTDFQAASKAYQSTLKGAGHFAALCDHGMGHMIPTAAAPSVWAFFQANGFGVYPSPYAGGLPSSFPSYCSL